MKKNAVYHGTVAGKNDIFLESFIMTGALSGKSRDPWDQGAGFYVSINSGWAQLFSHTKEEKDIPEWERDERPLHCGRGIIVEVDYQHGNMDDWDIDHEMSYGYSMTLLRKFEDVILNTEFETGVSNNPLSTFQDNRVFILKKCENGYEVEYKSSCSTRKNTVLEFRDESALGNRDEAFLLDKVHRVLTVAFPEKYRQEKQAVTARMFENECGVLKYVGASALKVDKIYLRPLDSPVVEDNVDPNNLLGRWEVAYERQQPKKKDFAVSSKIKPSVLSL